MNKTLLVIAGAFILGGMMSAPLLLSALDPGRFSADKETQELCKKDGGIHVYEKIGLEAGRFPTVIPDAIKKYDGTRAGTIYDKYRYEESHTLHKSHGYFIYRYRTSIVAIANGKIVGEMVQYTRSGEPGLPGITCPETISNEKLINAVFSLENEMTNPFPACPSGIPKVIKLTPERPPTLVRERVAGGRALDDDVWRRGIKCDEQTKIDRWYEEPGTGGKLTGTGLQFFGPEGNRCQSRAMPDSKHIICDKDGLSVLGFKRQAGSASVLLQRFSKTGQMVSETEISNVAPAPGLIASYRETGDQIKINVVNSDMNNTRLVKCYSVFVSKSKLSPHESAARIGPPDTVFQYPDCDTKE